MQFVIMLIIGLFLNSALMAQQGPDPIFLQKALAAVQVQRDTANNNAALEAARGAMLTDEVAKLKAELEELKKSKTEPSNDSKN